jgi:hypothetical protein
MDCSGSLYLCRDFPASRHGPVCNHSDWYDSMQAHAAHNKAANQLSVKKQLVDMTMHTVICLYRICQAGKTHLALRISQEVDAQGRLPGLSVP